MAGALERLTDPSYELSNLKIYEINKTDSYISRYDLKTNNGKITFNFVENNFSLVDSNNNFIYLNAEIERMDFDKMNIENNKLVLYLKNADNIMYGVESKSPMELNDLAFSLKSILNRQAVDIKCLEKLCKLLETAICEGSIQQAALAASQLASVKARLSIRLESIMRATEPTRAKNEPGPLSTSEYDDKAEQIDRFNVFCVVIKDGQENRNIYLENVFLTMTVNDLKQKV